MPNKIDPEFAKATEPVAKILASAPRFPAFDVNARLQALAGFAALVPAAPVADGVEVTKHHFTSIDGASIELQRLRPDNTVQQVQPGPCILHFHGGGFIAGDVEMAKAGISHLVAATGVQVFSVEYRLAPAHQNPIPVEDCYAALKWVLENAKEFDIDVSRVAVMGESAGGGLAAGTALLARDRQLMPPLAKQILIYPMLDDRSAKDLSDVSQYVLWDNDDNKTGWKALLGDRFGTDEISIYAAPGRAQGVQGLPSTYMDIGALDVFVEADLTYMTKLAAANVDIEMHVYPGVPHIFEVLAPSVSTTLKAFENRKRAILSF